MSVGIPQLRGEGRRFLPLLLALLGLLLFMAPYAWLRSESYITLEDNLDTELSVPWLLTRTDKALDYRPTTTVPELMNGVPRNALRPGLNVAMLVFAALEPLPAYLLQQLLVRLVGLVGMYLLLRRYGLPEPECRPLAAGLALAWAVLPIFSMFGISVLGQPWVLLALLNLRYRSGHWANWLPLVLFPLWSHLVLAGAFVVAGSGVLVVLDAVQSRRLAWRPALGVALLAATYVATEYPLLYALLIERQFVPHRLEFDFARLSSGGVGVRLKSSLQYLLLGQYHSSLFVRVAPLLAAGLAWWAVPAGRRAELRRPLLLLLGILVVLAGFCGFYPKFVGALPPQLAVLRAFNLSRFHFLTPLLWFAVLVLSLRYLPKQAQWTLVGLQLLIGLGMNLEWTANLRRLAGRPRPQEPAYAAYVAEPLFNRIRTDIARRTGQQPAQYRVACLGFPPAVATLNGFYALDAYLNNYPLTYKHQFRPLIAGELAKSPLLQAYFDAWGNRCYLFSAELGKNFQVGAKPARVIRDWAFDAAAFRRLGGRYVLSGARLAAPGRSGLQLAGHYAAAGAYWHIWVYEVNP